MQQPKILIISSRSDGDRAEFPNAWSRYGDKWFAKRSFSGLFFRVTRTARTLRMTRSQAIPLNAGCNSFLRILRNGGCHNDSTLPIDASRNNASEMRVAQAAITDRQRAQWFRVRQICIYQAHLARRVCSSIDTRNEKARHCRARADSILPPIHFASFAI